MDTMPKTTLTQKRKEITTGAKKLTKEKLDHSDDKHGPDKGAVAKIVIWIVVVVFIGVGAALFLTNVLSGREKQTDTSDTDIASEPISYPITEDLDDIETTESESEQDMELESEIEKESETTATAESEPVTEEETETATETNTNTTTVNDLEEYANTDRELQASTTGNNLIINKFRFFGTGTEFNYHLRDLSTSQGNIDPDIKLYYEGNDLIMEIGNVAVDNVIGQGRTNERVFTGLAGISKLITTNNNNASKYRFVMSEKYNSRVEVDTENREIRLQIDNR